MESHHIHSDAVLRLKGQECKGANGQGSILDNGESSDAVLRVKGQECKGVNDQGSILYNGESSHPFRCYFEAKGSRM